VSELVHCSSERKRKARTMDLNWYADARVTNVRTHGFGDVQIS